MALTNHLDRSPDKRLLRGRVGYVHSWSLNSTENSKPENGVRILQKLPKVVFVKFYGSDGEELQWRLPGTPENGVYPVTVKKKSWYFDKGRMHPVLRITRCQLPLAPAFAMTAHAAQGQTFKGGCVVDF